MERNNRKHNVRIDLLTVLLGMGLLFVTWTALINTPRTASTMPYVGVWVHLFLVLYMAGMLWLLTSKLSPRLRTNSILLWLGLFFFAILTIRLKDTPFTVGGINGDARFYTTYVTKMAAYPGYGDMFYKDLPSFYPPLYYFLVGLVADWLNIEPFRVMKYALLTTVVVLPFVTAWLWRRIVDERIAAAVALCMLVFPDWFKPNEWLALALFVPWWLHWVDNITAYTPTTRMARWRWWLGGGLLGALIFQLYFFWLFVGGTTLLAKVGWWLYCRRTDRQLRRQLTNSVVMLSLTALFSSPFWLPYLLSMITAASAQPLQNRFFGASKTPLPLYFFQDNWQSVVYLGGLIYLLVAAQFDSVARGLRWLVAGFTLWVGLGYVAILIDMPLLTFRSYPILAYLLGAGAFLGLFRLWQNSPQLATRWPKIPWRLCATTLLLLVVLLFANTVTLELLEQDNVQDAVAATYPANELAAFDQLTSGNYHDRVVFVTDSYRSILFFRPIYSFLAWSAHFSHPAGSFHRRVDFLHKVAALHDPLLFAQALSHNRYDQIDYWLLRQEEAYWHFSFVDDNFPDRSIDRDIYFPKHLLNEPYFHAESVDEFTMLTPIVRPPLPTVARLPDEAQTMAGRSIDAAARAYLLTTHFVDDIFVDSIALSSAKELRAASYALLINSDLTGLSIELLLDLQGTASGELATTVEQAVATKLHFGEPVTLLDDAGTPTVDLLGYHVGPHTIEGSVELTLYWKARRAIDESFGIWLHAFAIDRQGSDSEKSTFDHDPPLTTTIWSPGTIYTDQVHLPLPPGDYRLETGFWNAESDTRLKQSTGEWGITLGVLPLP